MTACARAIQMRCLTTSTGLCESGQDESRILEVGCGSGQATLPLANRGYAIDCVEIGGRMAAIARRNLSAFPRVKVICDKFETAALPRAHYDLLFSAMAFHWIDPAIRFQLAHDLLVPGGVIALFWHRPVGTKISREFVAAQQEIYRRTAPQLAKRYYAPTRPEDASTEYDQLITGSNLFEDLAIRKHYAKNEYDTESYIALLETFSGHRLLPAAQRHALLTETKALIKDEFAGSMSSGKPWFCSIWPARKDQPERAARFTCIMRC